MHNTFATALAIWAATLMILGVAELLGLRGAVTEQVKLRMVGGTLSFSMLTASVRSAFTSKEDPSMYRMSALLFVGQLICIFSDVLAFDESPDEQAPSSGSGSSWFASSSNPRPAGPKSMKRFASEYLTATIGALAVHYLISFAYILLQTFQWRTLNELYGGLIPGRKKKVVIAYANVG